MALHSHVSTADINAVVDKASAGSLLRAFVSNVSASIKYLKLYNKASTPIPGTDTPIMRFALAPDGVLLPLNSTMPPPGCLADARQVFTLGIAYTIVAGVADDDDTAVGEADVILTAFYD
jgi:hypothetical protein